MRKLLLSSATLALALIGPVQAHHEGEIVERGDLIVSHAWMHENAEMAHSGAVYLTIENQGEQADRLIAAEVDFADRVVFQAQAVDAEGVLEVRDLAAIKVNPGQVLTLKPSAVWIELESVQRTFIEGDHFEMTLTFDNAGTVEIEVEIEPLEEHEHEEAEDDDVS